MESLGETAAQVASARGDNMATAPHEQPGDWFSSYRPDEMSAVVEQLARDGNPEDLADLVDIAQLGASTPDGLLRHDALMGAITTHRELFSSDLLDNIFESL